MQEVFENIIEKLEKELKLADVEKLRCARENPLQFDSAKGYANGVANSIEIVKQVAAEQNNGWIPCSERLPSKEEYLKDDGRFMLDDGNRRYQGLFDIYDGKFKFTKHISGLHYELFEDNCVIAWQPLPPRYNPDGEQHEKKTKYDQIRSMCVDEMASFLSEVKYDGIYYNEGMEYPIISEAWEEWLQSEVEG